MQCMYVSQNGNSAKRSPMKCTKDSNLRTNILHFKAADVRKRRWVTNGKTTFPKVTAINLHHDIHCSNALVETKCEMITFNV